MEIATLNEEGKCHVNRFVLEHAKAEVSVRYAENIEARLLWWNDAEAAFDGQQAILEMAARYSKTGRPVTESFGRDCFDFETIEEN